MIWWYAENGGLEDDFDFIAGAWKGAKDIGVPKIPSFCWELSSYPYVSKHSLVLNQAIFSFQRFVLKPPSCKMAVYLGSLVQFYESLKSFMMMMVGYRWC